MPEMPSDDDTSPSLLQQMLEDANRERVREVHHEPQPTAPPPHVEIRVLEAKEPSRREILIADIDAKVSAQVGELLSHPDVQRLQRAWAGLAYLVEHVDIDKSIRVAFLNCSKPNLVADFEEATAVTVSGLYRRLCEPDYLPDDGAPVSLVVADYDFGHHQQDIELLSGCAAAAADGHAPFLANASPSFFGCERFADMVDLGHLARYFGAPRFAAWDSFRETEDARYAALCVPADQGFEHPASMAFAIEIAHTFAKHRSFGELAGRTASATSPSGAGLNAQQVGDTAAQGIIALRQRNDGTGLPCSVGSTQKPKRFPDTAEGRALASSSIAGTQLPNTLSISRVAHFVEALGRELGAPKRSPSIEQALQARLEECVRGARVRVIEGDYLRYELELQSPREPSDAVLRVAGTLGGSD